MTLRVLVCAVVLLCAVDGRAQEIWQTPDGRRCMENWISDTTARLNRYNGSAG
jgi:hypothetical protein